MPNDRDSHLFCVYLQVLKAKFALCQYIAQNIKTFSKRSAFYALDGLVDKIGDVKVRSSLIWLYCLRFAVFTISHNLFLWLPTNLLKNFPSFHTNFIPSVKGCEQRNSHHICCDDITKLYKLEGEKVICLLVFSNRFNWLIEAK